MPSLVAWLDASSEDQRRMREIVNLFSERESRDELGIGQVRDALSDILFPGTSTLLTRARYMLLIPWCFLAAARPGLSPDSIAQRVDANERNLIVALKAESDGDGLLGKSAGTALKNLPSSIYWVALRQYGILTQPTMSQADASAAGLGPVREQDVDEILPGAWSLTLPGLPDGFPHNTGGGFDLKNAEAGWLRERMLEGSEGSLLSHLLDHRPERDSGAPWLDPAVSELPADTHDSLTHARLFSFAMHGAALLYNLLLAEAYEEGGFDRVNGAVDRYQEQLATWRERQEVLAPDLASWDRDDFWATILTRNQRATSSRVFIDRWLDGIISDAAVDPATDSHLRYLIQRREQQHKGSQSRLRNTRLLQTWQGASGAGQLVFRWPQVRGILTDLHDGLERTDA
nr:DUF6361 family protein [Salinibacterium sp. ZJ450]